MKPLVLFIVILLLVQSGRSAEVYGDDYEPAPPVPFPSTYRDYQILPRSVSPDHKRAFTYPKRSRLYKLPHVHLCLVTLQPFSVLSEIPIQDMSLAGNAHGYYTVNWNSDSSVAVFIVGEKWGPAQAWLVQFRDAKILKLTNLVKAVRRQVLPEYRKSHAPSYNDSRDFIFEGDDQWTISEQGRFTLQRGWDLDSLGHVIVDTICTTDPKGMERHGWTVRFKGTWDITDGKFVKKSLTRMLPKPYLEG